MSDPPPKLKHPTGWFAAGREVTGALELLSDGAFKLYIYLCLHADRRTGQLCAEQARLAKAVGKSRRSVVTYLDELRQRGVCNIHAAVNQHVGGQIEICDAFWPYERVQPSTIAEALPAFIEQTKRLLAARRCIGIKFAGADARLAASLFDRHIPIEDVEHAVLLGCARKYVTLINRQRGELIASFSYFANVIEEVRELKNAGGVLAPPPNAGRPTRTAVDSNKGGEYERDCCSYPRVTRFAATLRTALTGHSSGSEAPA